MGNCLLNFGLLPYANEVWRQILKNYIRPVIYWQLFVEGNSISKLRQKS